MPQDDTPTFPTGTTVQLMSGGPLMTVEAWQSQLIRCQWFSGSKLQRGTFHPSTLKIVPNKNEDTK